MVSSSQAQVSAPARSDLQQALFIQQLRLLYQRSWRARELVQQRSAVAGAVAAAAAVDMRAMAELEAAVPAVRVRAAWRALPPPPPLPLLTVVDGNGVPQRGLNDAADEPCPLLSPTAAPLLPPQPAARAADHTGGGARPPAPGRAMPWRLPPVQLQEVDVDDGSCSDSDPPELINSSGGGAEQDGGSGGGGGGGGPAAAGHPHPSPSPTQLRNPWRVQEQQHEQGQQQQQQQQQQQLRVALYADRFEPPGRWRRQRSQRPVVGQGPAQRQHEVQQQQQQQQYELPVMDAMWQAASRTETAQNAAAAAVTTAPHDASALVPATPLLCAPLPCSFLAPGICFTGWQRQAAPAGLRRGLTEAWAVSVTLLEVDMAQGRVTGTMRAHILPKPAPPVETLWDGDVIDDVNNTFYTQAWGASRETDVEHWSKLPGWDALKPRVLRFGGRAGALDAAPHVYLRIKERCFVPPLQQQQQQQEEATQQPQSQPQSQQQQQRSTAPPTRDAGLTIAGFYYLALNRATGCVAGLYHDPCSTPFQALSLRPVTRSTNDADAAAAAATIHCADTSGRAAAAAAAATGCSAARSCGGMAFASFEFA